MNCQTVQNKILALPDPRLLPDPLREHVAGCVACREWAKQAARLEALVEKLPAPAAPVRKKAALIDHVTRGEPIITPSLAIPAAPRESRAVAFLRRNATVIAGLAAAVLVAIGAWALFPKNEVVTAKPIPDDPFLKKMVDRDVALARADNPAKRLEILGLMAEDLSTQARALSRVASPEELRDLARWYGKVVNNAIVPQVKRMHGVTLKPADAAERTKSLEALNTQLGATATEADRLLAEVPPESKPALQTIADSARDGQKTIELIESEMRGKDKN
jgi:hypothetical protein